jgi:hypothetical protein
MKTGPSILAALACTLVTVIAFAEPPRAPTPSAPVASTPAPAAKATAAPKAPFGMGNFRREEVARAAGVDPAHAKVTGLATAGKHIAGVVIPANIRVQAVAVTSGPDKGKVTLVKAPVAKDEPVAKLTDGEAKSMVILTQPQAQAAAEKNRGVAGSKDKVTLQADGFAGYGYGFKQVAPRAQTVKEYGRLYEASDIRRSVTFTQSGESASFTKTSMGPAPTLAPAPAPSN